MNNNSNVNTILIVIILLLLVGFGVWYFRGGAQLDTQSDEAGFNLNVDIPTGDEGGEQP